MPVERVLVTGRVQGVGFRAYVQRLATELGLSGEVWNRKEGGVEAIVSHDEPMVLDRFGDRLRHGPGYVASIERTPHGLPATSGFRITSTR